MFKQLTGDKAVVNEKGVFKDVDLYEWSGQLFVRLGGGYVYLKGNGATSKSGCQLVFLESTKQLYSDAFNRLYMEPMEGRKAVGRGSEGPLALPGPTD